MGPYTVIPQKYCRYLRLAIVFRLLTVLSYASPQPCCTGLYKARKNATLCLILHSTANNFDNLQIQVSTFSMVINGEPAHQGDRYVAKLSGCTVDT